MVYLDSKRLKQPPTNISNRPAETHNPETNDVDTRLTVNQVADFVSMDGNNPDPESPNFNGAPTSPTPITSASNIGVPGVAVNDGNMQMADVIPSSRFARGRSIGARLVKPKKPAASEIISGLESASPTEKGQMLRNLRSGRVRGEDRAAMATVLQSASSAAEMDDILDRVNVGELWDAMGRNSDGVGQFFNSMGQAAVGDSILLEIAKHLPANSKLADDFVADHVDAGVLQAASSDDKVKMLKHLMRGSTNRDEQAAMRRILESTSTPAELMDLLNRAGRTEAVMKAMGREEDAFINNLKNRGTPGQEAIVAMAVSFDPASRAAGRFVVDHVDTGVLAQASIGERGVFLRQLMTRGTNRQEEQAMAQILSTASSPAELSQLLTQGGGADSIWSGLGRAQDDYISQLKATPPVPAQLQQVATWATALRPSPDSKAFVLDHIDDAVLAESTVDQKSDMIARARYGRTDDESLTAVRKILMSAANSAELLRIANGAGGLNRVLELGNGAVDFQQRVASLLADPQFAALSDDEEKAALAQIRNYPTNNSVDNIHRLVGKPWFTGQSLEDKQRSFKVVAFLGAYTGGDRTIIDNTLDQFLAPGAAYQFDWNARSTVYGSALNNQMHFNRKFVAADNKKIKTGDYDQMHLVTHTFAHEVNHLVNGDRVAPTFDYFMEEYRAYWVGYRAEHGQDPTREEMAGRARVQLRQYPALGQALTDPVEGPQIVAFMRLVLGRNDVTAANIMNLAPRDSGRIAPAPPAIDDLDN